MIQRPQICAPRADFIAPPDLRASAKTGALAWDCHTRYAGRVGEGGGCETNRARRNESNAAGPMPEGEGVKVTGAMKRIRCRLADAGGGREGVKLKGRDETNSLAPRPIAAMPS